MLQLAVDRRKNRLRGHKRSSRSSSGSATSLKLLKNPVVTTILGATLGFLFSLYLHRTEAKQTIIFNRVAEAQTAKAHIKSIAVARLSASDIFVGAFRSDAGSPALDTRRAEANDQEKVWDTNLTLVEMEFQDYFDAPEILSTWEKFKDAVRVLDQEAHDMKDIPEKVREEKIRVFDQDRAQAVSLLRDLDKLMEDRVESLQNQQITIFPPSSRP